MTLTVELRNPKAIDFLRDMERVDLVRLITPTESIAQPTFAERFFGCISKEQGEELQKELVQMRNEWNRDSY
ncbi:hypothetical protein AGMMS49938_03880 [Fibrobacterales bacterium]|nr:hypothetical protein AGMMS49938_03880 [Fibrobacterales bacterium]